MSLNATHRFLTAFIVLYVIAIIVTRPAISHEINISSNGENVSSNSSIDSDIQRLALETEAQKRRAGIWDSCNLGFVGLAGLAAVGLVITGLGVSQSNRKLNDLSETLSKAKDAKLAFDLKTKDEQIAKTLGLAGSANERAGKFEADAARLSAENLQLEVAITPRRLSERQKTGLSGLSQFSGHLVEIKSYSSDTEGLILATQILGALAKARMTILDNRLTMQPAGTISFGVSVTGDDKALVEELKKILAEDGNLTAASSIVAPDKAGMGISFGVSRSSTPPDAIILIGAKPIPIDK